MNTIDRVHHEILLHSQRNARWSYNNPPLAQLPRDLATLYRPDPGWPWVEWDWDQLELRIVACLSRDATMLEVFAKGWDIHFMTACAVFGLDLPSQLKDPVHAEENAEWRRVMKWLTCNHLYGVCGKDDIRRTKGAKGLGHGISYGLTERGAANLPGARVLGLSGKDVQRAFRNISAMFPGRAAWQDRLVEEALRVGETRTWAGRRRRYLDRGKGNYLRGEILDQPAQAGAQDLSNEVFLEVAETFGADVIYKFGKHDSQIWGIRESEWDRITPQIRTLVTRPRMIDGVEMTFPASFKERRL